MSTSTKLYGEDVYSPALPFTSQPHSTPLREPHSPPMSSSRHYSTPVASPSSSTRTAPRRSIDEASDLSSEATLYSLDKESSKESLKLVVPQPPDFPDAPNSLDFLRIQREVKLVLAGEKSQGTADDISESAWEEFNSWADNHLPHWEGLRCVL